MIAERVAVAVASIGIRVARWRWAPFRFGIIVADVLHSLDPNACDFQRQAARPARHVDRRAPATRMLVISCDGLPLFTANEVGRGVVWCECSFRGIAV